MPDVLLKESLSLPLLADGLRRDADVLTQKETRVMLGQYMTPSSLAAFMASLFPIPTTSQISLLDPGAGIGSLTAAFVEYLGKKSPSTHIEVDAYEVDARLCSYLEKNLHFCENKARIWGHHLDSHVLNADFITEVSNKIYSQNSLWPEKLKKYTHCIMNPPYKKISSSSHHRHCLHTVGIETVNLYTAFVALSLLVMVDGGILVAIIPRSFCNGPYYLSFRKFILGQAAIRRVHLFASRNKAFEDYHVLQENIIIVLEKKGEQKEVVVSTSTDNSFLDISIQSYPFSQMVMPEDKELFIRIPSLSEAVPTYPKNVCFSLSNVGLEISTGPVVDFRVKEYLRKEPERDTVPLLYPCHFREQSLRWPIECGKKPNAILSNPQTESLFYPNGFYTVVRRFSSKEEKRRIIASVVDPERFLQQDKIAFENHVNVFHRNKHPLPEMIARGLAIFLNSTQVDEYFRCFSGHTQVNATDLRCLKYPSLKILSQLGMWAATQAHLTQQMMDRKVGELCQ